jgi:hypothetical protein
MCRGACIYIVTSTYTKRKRRLHYLVDTCFLVLLQENSEVPSVRKEEFATHFPSLFTIFFLLRGLIRNVSFFLIFLPVAIHFH